MNHQPPRRRSVQETLPIEMRVNQIEQRLDRLEAKFSVRKGISIPQNVYRWFRTHRFLGTLQFAAELRAVTPEYSDSSIRTALWRMASQGRIVRVRDGLYTEPEEESL